MPTPDASQYTQFRRYTSVAGDALGSVGSKISPFNTAYSIPMLTARTQELFLPSANKEKKFPPLAPGILGPIWVSEIGNGNGHVSVYGIATDPNDGTIIVCGQTDQVLFNGSIGDSFNYSKAFVARYTTSGTFIAGTTLGSGATSFVDARCVTTDVHGNIYVCGGTFENLNDSSISYSGKKGFYAKFSSSFSLIYVVELGSGRYFTETSTIMASPDGYLYVGGNTLDTNWYNSNPHSEYDYEVGYLIYCDSSTGEMIYGSQYGSGNVGSTYITGLAYLPIGIGGLPTSAIAISGHTIEDIGAIGVPDAGEGGYYGFLAFTFFDLEPLGIAGVGSGDNFTILTCVRLATTPCGTILWVGGQTNEYLSGENQNSRLAGQGYQGFVAPFVLSGPGFIGYFSLIGDEQNYTAVTALSSDNNRFYVGGFSSENLTTGEPYNGMVLTNFTLQTDFASGFTDIKQIGTGTSFQILTSMESDTFGNFYVGGLSAEHLPSGPSLGGDTTIGYIAKIADQPKTYNTPIFYTQDPSYNSGQGYCQIDYTAPVSIDWGDGTVDTITTGSSGAFTHPYINSGTYNITVDAGSGGEITLFRATGVGIMSLDASRCPTLVSLRCDGNFITTLDVSGCPNLEYLRCNNNQLQTLDVSGLNLNYLRFPGGDNAISTIHFEGCGLSNMTNKTLEDAILDLNNGDYYPGRIYLDSNQQSLYFNGNAQNYFSGSLPDWTFIILPGIPDVIVTADLTGLTFDGSGDPGHNYANTFNFSSGQTIEVRFINVPPSIKNVQHVQFDGTQLTTTDKFFITNPLFSINVSTLESGGTVYLYVNDSLPMNSGSKVILVTTNGIDGVRFSMS